MTPYAAASQANNKAEQHKSCDECVAVGSFNSFPLDPLQEVPARDGRAMLNRPGNTKSQRTSGLSRVIRCVSASSGCGHVDDLTFASMYSRPPVRKPLGSSLTRTYQINQQRRTKPGRSNRYVIDGYSTDKLHRTERPLRHCTAILAWSGSTEV